MSAGKFSKSVLLIAMANAIVVPVSYAADIYVVDSIDIYMPEPSANLSASDYYDNPNSYFNEMWITSPAYRTFIEDRYGLGNNYIVPATAGHNTDVIALGMDTALNYGSILSNVTGITNNTADIATNVTGITNNTADIATNVTGITNNTAGIATNVTGITNNAADIATNVSNIYVNSTNIQTNSTSITNLDNTINNVANDLGNVTYDISTISTNSSNISTNSTNIQMNSEKIEVNSGHIAVNSSNIAVNSANISTNSKNIEVLAHGLFDAVQNIEATRQYVNQVRDEAMRGIAITNALEVMLPDPGKRGRINMGWGHYGGASAFGVTAASRITDDLAFYGGVGLDSRFEEVGAKVGVSMQW